MADVINLRQARKQRARADAEQQAMRNRAAHGRTKGEKRGAEADLARRRAALDGAKRED
jgi:hypothetical protein